MRYCDFSIEEHSLIALILTHVHYDHCENAKKVEDNYQTQIVVHESEANLLSGGVNSLTGGAIPITRFFFNVINGKKLMTKGKYEPIDCTITVHEQFDLKEFGFAGYILHTPGHTQGSMSIILDNEIAIVGDAMFGVFTNSIYPPWAADTSLMIKSWKKLLDTGCKIFLPSHGSRRLRGTVEKQYNKYKNKIE